MPPPTTIHHDPPPSTTTHRQPKYIHHHSPPPTTSQNISTTTYYHSPPSITIHHQPKYIHCHLSLPKKLTTTLQEPKYIHIQPPFDIALTVSFSSKCNIPSVTEILCEKVLISSFFKFQISTTFRSSHRRCSVRIDVLRNFAKFTGKHLTS